MNRQNHTLFWKITHRLTQEKKMNIRDLRDLNRNGGSSGRTFSPSSLYYDKKRGSYAITYDGGGMVAKPKKMSRMSYYESMAGVRGEIPRVSDFMSLVQNRALGFDNDISFNYSMTLVDNVSMELLRVTSKNSVVQRNLDKICSSVATSNIYMQIGHAGEGEIVEMQNFSDFINSSTTNIKADIVKSILTYGFVILEMVPNNPISDLMPVHLPITDNISSYITPEDLRNVIEDDDTTSSRDGDIEMEINKLLKMGGHTELRSQFDRDPLFAGLPDGQRLMELFIGRGGIDYEEEGEVDGNNKKGKGKSKEPDSLSSGEFLKERLDELRKEYKTNGGKTKEKKYTALKHLSEASKRNLPYKVNIIDPNNVDVYVIYDKKKVISNMTAVTRNGVGGSGTPNMDRNTGRVETNNMIVCFDPSLLYIDGRESVSFNTPVSMSIDPVIKLDDLENGIVTHANDANSQSLVLYRPNGSLLGMNTSERASNLEYKVVNDDRMSTVRRADLEADSYQLDSDNVVEILDDILRAKRGYDREQRKDRGNSMFRAYGSRDRVSNPIPFPISLPPGFQYGQLTQGQLTPLIKDIMNKLEMDINCAFGIEDSDADKSINKSSVEQVKKEKESLMALKTENLLKNMRYVCVRIMLDQYSRPLMADAAEYLDEMKKAKKNGNNEDKNNEVAEQRMADMKRDLGITPNSERGFNDSPIGSGDGGGSTFDFRKASDIMALGDLGGLLDTLKYINRGASRVRETQNGGSSFLDLTINNNNNNNSNGGNYMEIEGEVQKMIYSFFAPMKFSAVSSVIRPISIQDLQTIYREGAIDPKTYIMYMRSMCGVNSKQMLMVPPESYEQRKRVEAMEEIVLRLYGEVMLKYMTNKVDAMFPKLNSGGGAGGFDNKSKVADDAETKAGKSETPEDIEKTNNLANNSREGTSLGKADNTRPAANKKE